jgi:hypothetical protein
VQEELEQVKEEREEDKNENSGLQEVYLDRCDELKYAMGRIRALDSVTTQLKEQYSKSALERDHQSKINQALILANAKGRALRLPRMTNPLERADAFIQANMLISDINEQLSSNAPNLGEVDAGELSEVAEGNDYPTRIWLTRHAGTMHLTCAILQEIYADEIISVIDDLGFYTTYIHLINPKTMSSITDCIKKLNSVVASFKVFQIQTSHGYESNWHFRKLAAGFKYKHRSLVTDTTKPLGSAMFNQFKLYLSKV